MTDHCIVCNRSVPGGEGDLCCPGCAAVYTIGGKMGLEGEAGQGRNLSPKYCAVGMVFSNLVVIFNFMYGMNLPKRSND